VLHRHAISDADWERIKDLLPGRPGQPGWVAKDNRLFIDAVLWIAKTGAPWRDLPERFGPWNSVWKRFDCWSKKGTWQGGRPALASLRGPSTRGLSPQLLFRLAAEDMAPQPIMPVPAEVLALFRLGHLGREDGLCVSQRRPGFRGVAEAVMVHGQDRESQGVKAVAPRAWRNARQARRRAVAAAGPVLHHALGQLRRAR
jgi:transposase